MSRLALWTALMLTPALPAAAEWQLSLYTGYQTAPHSTVEGNDPAGVGAFNFTAGWDGRSFSSPPFYGVRATYWRNARWGYSLDFNHNKVYADDQTLAISGFETLEFTDGINTLTLSAMRRWQRDNSRWTPYAGAGIGFALPHVEVQTTAATPRTFEYQIDGPALQIQLGMEYEISERWSAFGEYKGNYIPLEAELESGGELDTTIITNAINLGVSLRF